MKTELPCGIVQDLLPSYADGVAGEDSVQAVEAHVAACPACAAKLAEMKAPLPERETAVREVNYLKKVQRSKRKAVAVAVAVALLAGCVAVVFAPMLDVRQASSRELDYEPVALTQTEDGRNAVLFTCLSGVARRWIVALEGYTVGKGEVDFIVTTGGMPLLWRVDSHLTKIMAPYEGPLKRVTLNGREVLWENGVPISGQASDLYNAATPYCGDIMADQKIAQLADIRLICGDGGYTSDLQTSQEPYVWRVILNDPPADYDTEEALNAMMSRVSCVVLALIGNLDAMEWEYTFNGTDSAYRVSTEDASALLSRDVKQFAASACDVQQLLIRLERL